ncbi:C-C motif chemokine 22-like [Pseudorasbora parva]|uniref:C-C motif chemokine 22-like n=1 Tax=Pseudorasbora parva TaxID=51549 RepID=UPI00351EFF7A
MMTILKISLLFLMLCCAMQLTSAGPLASEAANSKCCSKEISFKIPRRALESYYWTSSSCPLRHIVFVTIHKKHHCVKPDNKWAQLYINHIDKKINLI